MNLRAATPPEPMDEIVFQRMRKEKLHSAISMLPEIQRRRVNLYFFGGYTYEQIAKREGCTKRAVKKSVDGAIENLKKYLEEVF